MPMDRFFEAFVETVLQDVSRRIGAQFRSGRNRETVQPLMWEPTLTNSQRSLVPDFMMECGSTTFVIDAKYKRHFEELETQRWNHATEDLRDQHRSDIFQALAYANLARTPRVVTCLAYPCTEVLWKDLAGRNRLVHKAELATGDRSISLWLTALPMGSITQELISFFECEFRSGVVL